MPFLKALKVTSNIILAILLFSCSDQTGKAKTTSQALNVLDTARFNVYKGGLTKKTLTIDVSYAAISCTCPQWFEKGVMNDTSVEREYFYLEQGSENLIKADTLWNGRDLPLELSLVGQFYIHKGYPRNYNPSKGDPQPARVFRYNSLEIIRKAK